MSGKGDDVAGGLPRGVYNNIVNSIAPAGGAAKGNAAEQKAVLLALAQMENAALNPGNGSTSVVEAMVQYVAIAQGATDLVNAPQNDAPAQTAAINKIITGLTLLTALFTNNGPVGAESDFVGSVPKKP